MSNSRTKRPFAGAASDPAQRQITSFFGRSSSLSGPRPDTSSTVAADSPFASAEASVQSSLLSVGMRVRKAVPGGYKTGTYSGLSLSVDNRQTVSKASDLEGIFESSDDAMGGRSRANAVSTSRNELAPFCGIHKIGNMSTQPDHTTTTSSTFTYRSPMLAGDMDAMSDVPGLTLSQSSVESNVQTSPTNRRKRFFTPDEADSEHEDQRALQITAAAPPAPGQLNLSGWHRQQHGTSPLRAARVLAKPRSRTRNAKISGPPLDPDDVSIMNDDFGEAPFLDQESWDLEMSE